MRRVALAASALALGCADGAAAAVVTADPALRPSFRRGAPDYTVRCVPGEPVRLTIDPATGTRVGVAGRPARAGTRTVAVDLAPGRAVRLRVVRPERTRTHVVRCLPADFPRWQVRRRGTPQARWYLVTPNLKPGPGRDLEGPGYAVVLDSRGVPVWWMRRAPGPFDFDLQPDGLLSWTDYVGLQPFSARFEERALDGRLVRTFATVGWETNQHDFRVLPNGNGLLVTYRPRDRVDLSRWGGPEDATVMDGEVQEIDPQGRLVWSWSTKDHIPLGEARRWLPSLIARPAVVREDGRPMYDVAHVNSLDVRGGLLVISARYLDAAYGIDRATGAIRWKLGGTKRAESLAIEGDPYGSDPFGGQHDARLAPDGRSLTLYDNQTRRPRAPRAVQYRLDLAARRAKLVRDVRFGRVPESKCCGSTRRLAGGNWVTSWGDTPWVTEQRPSGRWVLTIRFRDTRATYRAVPVEPGRLSAAGLRAGMDAMAP